MVRAQSLTWWKEKTHSHEMSSDIHVCAYTLIHRRMPDNYPGKRTEEITGPEESEGRSRMSCGEQNQTG